MKIDGRAIAATIFEDLQTKVQSLKEKGIEPHLVIILIGNDPASESYVRSKKEKGEKIGCKVTIRNQELGVSNQELMEIIQKLNQDETVHGIIVQRPVPPQIDEQQLDEAVVPEKDIDGFHPNSKFDPPIAEAVFEILKSINIELKDKKIAVIGKGKTGGGPIIASLKKLNLNPTVIDSKTQDSGVRIQESDIVITAVGKANVLRAEQIKQGGILINLGMHREEDGKLHGDYDEHEIEGKAGFYTPTPGGVGPVNVACLLKNLIVAASH